MADLQTSAPIAQYIQTLAICVREQNVGAVNVYTDWSKKTETFEKPNKNWRNPRKKIYWKELNHYNLPFKRQ